MAEPSVGPGPADTRNDVRVDDRASDPDARVPELEPTWRRSIGDVLVTAVVAVAVVLGAAAITGFLPEPLQRIVFHTPLAIAVLVVGTAWLLWRIARKPGGDER